VESVKLPKALKYEPLIDAVFEVRLKDSASLGDILPGYLYTSLEPKSKIERLPAADLPLMVRQNDVNLKYVPTIRVDWENYYIAIGDQNLVVSCKLPYPKWINFKSAILSVVKKVSEVVPSEAIERFSLKYVNLIAAPTHEDQIQKINMNISLGKNVISKDPVNLQVHLNEDNKTHIITVVVGADAVMYDGSRKFGVVVDIDSITHCNGVSFSEFSSKFENDLEDLRQANKVKFFDCLTAETIKEMEPAYE